MKKEEFTKIANESLSQIQEGMEASTRQLYKDHKILTTLSYGLILEDSENKENMTVLTGGHGKEEMANALLIF